ncbi:LuxR C-terminal-related transcriptional regulator [Vibrio furnissii]|uniref:LuxR C-terminal-related transcriptional regulator n=1 Tax=Vibrio furnissii TaxID=29494 RepID=UPI001EEC2280|nr:LuxR C-terminal-related transcriptional regulator [Vibrio furnissii]MCG6216246.1 LuxR C-terminal-related transcriptional regulator [Vibrio furnissii]
MASEAFIITPSCLDSIEEQILLAHATGLSQRQIAGQLGTDLSTVELLERDLKRKLNAGTMANAIALAFLAGILHVKHASRVIDGEVLGKSLCVLLLAINVTALGDSMMRTRTPLRNSRTPTTVMRVMRAGRNKELDA